MYEEQRLRLSTFFLSRFLMQEFNSIFHVRRTTRTTFCFSSLCHPNLLCKHLLGSSFFHLSAFAFLCVIQILYAIFSHYLHSFISSCMGKQHITFVTSTQLHATSILSRIFILSYLHWTEKQHSRYFNYQLSAIPNPIARTEHHIHSFILSHTG